MNRAELKERAKSFLRDRWGWAALISLIGSFIIWVGGVIYTMVIIVPLLGVGLIGNDSELWIRVVTAYMSLIVAAATIFAIFQRMIQAGEAIGYKRLTEDKTEDNIFKFIFTGFRKKRAYPTFINVFFVGIFTFLWTLLFIIPGIIKSYSYAMTFYIMDDMVSRGEKISTTEAITRSKELMKGHKFQLFVLDLSFLGWAILATLCMGIGWLWLIPYINTTKAEFYHKLVKEN